MTDLDRITRQLGMMGGKPCIRGMRVTVGMIVGQLGAGRTIDELLADYPYLEREDVLQALRSILKVTIALLLFLSSGEAACVLLAACELGGALATPCRCGNAQDALGDATSARAAATLDARVVAIEDVSVQMIMRSPAPPSMGMPRPAKDLGIGSAA